MKICFLGAASVGKSTFLAALPCKNPDRSGAYWHFPMERQDGTKNEDAQRIAEIAQAIQGGHIPPATTEVHSGEGIIHFPEQSNDLCVEYIDFPGSAFSKGYDSSDAEIVEPIRSHAKDCDCFYLFIEPDDLNRDGGASRIKTFLNVFRDRKETNTNPKPISPYVCLTLTKADNVDEEDIRDGKSTHAQVKEYFEKHTDADCLAALRTEVGDGLFYAAFSTRRGGKLNLNDNEFRQLFYPLVDATNTLERNKKILWYAGIFIAILGCSAFYLCILPKWQAQADKRIVDQIYEMLPVTTHNIKSIESKAREIKVPATRVSVERSLQKPIEELKRIKTDDVKEAKKAYYMNPSDENKRRYFSECESYKKGFDDLPYMLKVNPIVEELPIIDNILHTRNTDNHLPSYLNARNHKIQEYLRRFSHNCTEAGQIIQAIQISQMLSETHHYTMSVKVDKLKDDNRMAFLVQTKSAPKGECYPKDEEDDVKAKGFTNQAEFNEKISFEWNASKPLELHVWNDNYNWCSFMGRIAPAPGEKFPIRHFCKLTQATLTDTNRGWHKDVRITTHIYVDDRKLESSDIDLMQRYIYDNVYWQERRNSVQEIINNELNNL